MPLQNQYNHNMLNKVVIGTRGSELALWQAHYVESIFKAKNIDVEIKIISTQGDEIQHLSFDKMEGKGFFTKEIEAALLNKNIDLAVHSHKDLETTNPAGLEIAAVSYRENPSDVLLILPHAYDASATLGLKKGAVVGTSSARRKTQLLAFRPDCSTLDLRGNVPTRIQKLKNQQYDAILLAAAGLNRLNISTEGLIVKELNPKEFIPAPAQGVLGLQIRTEDSTLKEWLQQNFHHPDVAQCIEEEREVLRNLDGGCQLPLGSYCYAENNQFTLQISLGISENEVLRLEKTSDLPKGLAHQILDALKKNAQH